MDKGAHIANAPCQPKSVFATIGALIPEAVVAEIFIATE